MSARLAVLEERLLPEKRIRPPLGQRVNPPMATPRSKSGTVPVTRGSRTDGHKTMPVTLPVEDTCVATREWPASQCC